MRGGSGLGHRCHQVGRGPQGSPSQAAESGRGRKRGCRQQVARPAPGHTGQRPSFLAAAGSWRQVGRQLHVGRQVSLGRWGRGGGPQRRPLCTCGVGDGERGDGGLVWEWFPTTTHLLPGPGSARNESPCLTLRGSPSVKTYPSGVLAEEAWLWPQIWLQPI